MRRSKRRTLALPFDDTLPVDALQGRKERQSTLALPFDALPEDAIAAIFFHLDDGASLRAASLTSASCAAAATRVLQLAEWQAKALPLPVLVLNIQADPDATVMRARQIGASSHEFHDARNAVYALDNEVQVAGRGESMMNAVMGLVYVWEKWVDAATAVIHDRQRALATAREDVGSPVMSTARCSSKHDEAMLDLDAEFAELMSCMHRLAHAHCKAANRLLVRNALRAELRKLPPEAESAASTGQLGDEAAMRVHFTRCHALWRAVLDTIKTRPDYGPRCSFTLHVTSCLCNVLSSLERHEEAEPMERMLLATREAILGAAHEKCVRTKENLAITLSSLGKDEEATALYRDVVDGYVKLEGPRGHQAQSAMASLIRLLRAAGRHEEVGSLERRAGLRLRRGEAAKALKSIIG